MRQRNMRNESGCRSLVLTMCVFVHVNSQPLKAPVFESPELHPDNTVSFRPWHQKLFKWVCQNKPMHIPS
jgi:hypothetical protein